MTKNKKKRIISISLGKNVIEELDELVYSKLDFEGLSRSRVIESIINNFLKDINSKEKETDRKALILKLL